MQDLERWCEVWESTADPCLVTVHVRDAHRASYGTIHRRLVHPNTTPAQHHISTQTNKSIYTGIIVTYASWRDIFWLQVAMSGAATLMVIFLLPETIHRRRSDELQGLSRAQKIKTLWSWVNPARVVILFKYPNLIVIGLASSSLVWNMYSLLTPIRYARTHLSLLQSPSLFCHLPTSS